MADVTEITTALIAPNQTLQSTDLDETWRNNPEGLRLGTYGVEALAPPTVLAHDHGQGRGTTLDRALLSLCFGPQGVEDPPGAATYGFPLLPTSGESFATSPKLMASSHLFLPAGVGNLYVTL